MLCSYPQDGSLTNDSNKPDIKRQRTVSESITSISRTATVEDESDEETATASRIKKARADAAQTARQAELREKEKERERARADAAGRRQERAGRRRVDGKVGKTRLAWRIADFCMQKANQQTAHRTQARVPETHHRLRHSRRALRRSPRVTAYHRKKVRRRRRRSSAITSTRRIASSLTSQARLHLTVRSAN